MSARRARLFGYPVGDEADQRRERRMSRGWIPMSIGLVASGLFVVLTIVNLFASGFANPARGTSVWESDQPFPQVPLPSWLTVPVGLLPLLTAILIWRFVDGRHGAYVTNTLVHTLTIFLLLPLLFAAVYAEPSPFVNGETTFGWHWLAVPAVLLAAVMLIIRRLTLPPTSIVEEAREPLFDEEVELYRRARTSRRHRETLEADVAALHARRAEILRDRGAGSGEAPS